MIISGPFLNPARKDSPKKWYLSYFAPKLGPDNTPLVVDGKPVMVRHRPHYESKALANSDKERLAGQYHSTGSGSFVHSREAQAEYEAAKKLLPLGESLVTAAAYFAKHHPRAADVVRIEAAREKFLAYVEAMTGKLHNYSTLKWRTDHFVKAFPGRVPASIQRAEIMAYLLALPYKPRGKLNQKRALCTFFGWMLDSARLIDANPAAGIKRKQLPKVKAKEIAFLTIEETRAHLRAAERFDPELVAHEVMQFFAGVRADDEMADFLGEWVLPATREVIVPAEAAKMGVREVMAGLEENFWAWWAVYGRTGTLRPANFKKRLWRVRVLARVADAVEADRLGGLSLDGLLREPVSAESLAKWPWNARRRTFCTYHVAKHQSAARTALILRHRGGEETLHRSYRGTGVTQLQGVAYFALAPAKVETPIKPKAHWRTNRRAATT